MNTMKATTTDLERERVRAALTVIVARNHGVLNPRAVLEEARDPAHVLHPFFEWDDALAGEQYRLLQVGALIRHVRLTVIKSDPETREVRISTTRGFQSRPSMRGQRGGYEPITDILSDATKRSELLDQVLRELTAYRRRYAQLSELEPIWIAVDEAIELSSSTPAAEDASSGASDSP